MRNDVDLGEYMAFLRNRLIRMLFHNPYGRRRCCETEVCIAIGAGLQGCLSSGLQACELLGR